MSVENHVRTVIAIGINAVAENVQPQTMLRAAEISDGQMHAIARVLERDFGVRFPALAYITWTTVADVVDATERALAAKMPRQAPASLREGEAA